jgi:hypothetical protein
MIASWTFKEVLIARAIGRYASQDHNRAALGTGRPTNRGGGRCCVRNAEIRHRALLVAGGSTANSQPPTPEESPLAGDSLYVSTKEKFTRMRPSSSAAAPASARLSAGCPSAACSRPSAPALLLAKALQHLKVQPDLPASSHRAPRLKKGKAFFHEVDRLGPHCAPMAPSQSP